ncbi:hypothetical protein [Paenibacillus puldeungensis]|uniref:hypothetical protein n=1 Tax=Paenibacillus puldeungensis TaxID=696536 RepID=UPI0036D43E64
MNLAKRKKRLVAFLVFSMWGHPFGFSLACHSQLNVNSAAILERIVNFSILAALRTFKLE